MIARVGRALVACALVLGASACFDFTSDTGFHLTTGPTAFGGGGGLLDQALVGSWARTTVLDIGTDVQSTQTIWSFRADGSATRSIVVTSQLTGLSTVTSSDAVWQTNGSTLIITFTAPDTGTLTFDFAVSGSTLLLNGVPFVRVG